MKTHLLYLVPSFVAGYVFGAFLNIFVAWPLCAVWGWLVKVVADHIDLRPAGREWLSYKERQAFYSSTFGYAFTVTMWGMLTALYQDRLLNFFRSL